MNQDETARSGTAVTAKEGGSAQAGGSAQSRGGSVSAGSVSAGESTSTGLVSSTGVSVPAGSISPSVVSADDFAAALARDPGAAVRQAVEAAVRAAVEPLQRAEAERLQRANLAALAADYPELSEPAGPERLSSALSALGREWGVGHLMANPPPELLAAAAGRAFGAERRYQAAREQGRQETLEAIRGKQGLSAAAAKPREAAMTPEEAAGEAIVNAGRKRGFFG